MNEEEKEAIKTLADLKERKFYTHAFDNGTLVLDDDEIESIDMVLNLIEKQQKEIDHWKKGIEIVDKDHKNYINKQYNKILEKEEIIEKQNKIIDKIKEKIEELGKKEKEELKGTKGQDRYNIKQEFMFKKNILQELLEEGE